MASIKSLFNSLVNPLAILFWYSTTGVMTFAAAVILQLIFIRPSSVVSYCKKIISFVYTKLYKLQADSRFDLYKVEANNDPIKTGFLSPPEEDILESPSSEVELLKKSDEVFFYGVNSKSQYLVVRLARGCNQEAEAWIHLQMGNGKTYCLKETSGFQQCVSDGRVFSCGGLQIQYLSPMRRWRIFFNGLLREVSDDEPLSLKMVHVKFSLLWHASSEPFDSLNDINVGDLAEGLSKAKWNSFVPPLKKLNEALDFYAQAGVITGIVTIDEDEHEIYLFGERMRFLGDIFFQREAEVFHLLGQIQKNGKRVHLVEVSIKNVVQKLRFGYIAQPSGAIDVISEFDVALHVLSSEDMEQNIVNAKFHADGDSYRLNSAFENKYRFCSKDEASHFAISCIDFEINSISGKGIVIKGNITKPKERTVPEISLQEAPLEITPLVLDFSDKLCQNASLTGGKGSSLGKLTELSEDDQDFIVPKGLVVTTVAYENFVTDAILNAIKYLENILYENVSGDLNAACQKVADEVIKSTIPHQVLHSILTDLARIFPDMEQTKFAVRSSAIGEDTEQLSAAGQMETFLGVTNVNEILTAVKKCWASQFSFIAVKYKRQYGQIINSPMAVVIQEMIPCDVAGVLFTCDPLTGNPNSMCITANYGLGESVVSGAEDPDAIKIKKSADETLTIENQVIGLKSRRIVMKNEGTTVEDVSEDERETCCLTNEMALRLGYLGVKIEKSCRSRRDIEWGFWNNNLYIFQSRPVTSLTEESDYEIDHEMDFPMRSEDEYFSICNVGEAMPGAVSTLGDDVMKKFSNDVFRRKEFLDWQVAVRGNYCSGGMITMHNHKMFYSLDLLDKINIDPNGAKLGSITLFGRIIDDEDMYDSARERHSHVKKESYRTVFNRFLRAAYLSQRRLKRAQKHHANYRLPIENFGTAQELFTFLVQRCTDLRQGISCHVVCTEASSIWNLIVLSILQQANRGVMNADVYREFSRLATTSSDVESADVPSALENLAFHISKDINPEEFKKMNVNEAVKFLETSNSISGIKYREFLTKHGHRCLKESDIHSETWDLNPKSLIQFLQSLVGSTTVKVQKNSTSVEELISTLTIPLNKATRFFLKMVIPLLRKAVQNREASKSVIMRGIDAWRKGYVRLSQLMVSEGRLPDEKLLFFMTLDEIRELLATRSPKIISKAVHRSRRYLVVDKLIFPEIKRGFPRPLNMDRTSIKVNDYDFSMKGVPVSRGVAKGFIRVALNLEEASHLKRGEILVTHSTDIGWSPYFPILAGVVTELGGLISHGAVVSREYGIPCVVALHGAIREFQTGVLQSTPKHVPNMLNGRRIRGSRLPRVSTYGDYALLDGNQGILQKLRKPEEDV